jgi:hypothetical protein
MTRTDIAPAPTSAGRTRRASAYGRGGPLVYLVALVVVAITLGPVLYGALGGFHGPTSNSRAIPPRCPTRGS